MRRNKIGPPAAPTPQRPAGTDSRTKFERAAARVPAPGDADRYARRDGVDVDPRGEGEELGEVAIPLDVRAPGAARAVVVRCLADHVASSVLDDAQLLVSELVTNSVRHSGAPEGDDVLVRVHLWRDMCRLEVEDHGRHGVIAPGPPDRAAGSGMGLNLVQMLSQRWGVIRPPDGPTRVWAQLSCARALA
jgi:anti-sigma regulatory factor (Ser/Thr protein kinase)